MSTKSFTAAVSIVVLLFELILFISLPKPEKWDLDGNNGKRITAEILQRNSSFSRTQTMVDNLEHQRDRYNNLWFSLFTITAVLGYVTATTIPDRKT